MPTVRTDDGQNISYNTFGTGPQNVFFLHGWGGSGSYFDEMLQCLDLTGLRAVTIDLRGHGASDKPATGYTLERIAADVFCVADQIKADKLVVVGFSMSGKFAQYLPVAQPQRIAGLVLVGPAPASLFPLPPEVHNDWVGRAGNPEKLMEITRMFTTQPVSEEIIGRWGRDAVKVPSHVLHETLKLCEESDFLEKVRLMQTSTLVVGGIHDTIFAPETLRQIVVDPLPTARLALLNANHEIPIEQPQELATLLQAFLAGLAA